MLNPAKYTLDDDRGGERGIRGHPTVEGRAIFHAERPGSPERGRTARRFPRDHESDGCAGVHGGPEGGRLPRSLPARSHG